MRAMKFQTGTPWRRVERIKGKKRKREKKLRITAYTGCFGVYTNDMIKREKKV